MKKYLTLLCALGAGSIAQAQSSGPEIQEFLQSPTFIKSIIASYGVDPDISPKPNSEEITKIQEIAPMLQSDQMTQLEAGAQALTLFVTSQATSDSKTTGVIQQIIGSIYFRLSSMVKNQSSVRSYQMQAIKFLNQATVVFPNYRQAHKNLARLYFQMGDNASIDKALKHFAKSIELGDKEAATYILLAKLYFDRNLYVAAETAARQAIMMAPEIKESRTILAYALFQQERFEEAQNVFEELLEKDPDDADIWLMIGNTFIQNQQIDEAANRLEVVRLMGEANSRTMGLLGDVYVNKGMVEDATQAYSEGLHLAETENAITLTALPEFIQSVETLNNFQAYELGRDLLDEIEAAYESILTDDERNNILALRSEINIALGDDVRAVQNLKDILSIDPLNARALLSLGQYYGRLRPADDKERIEAVELALVYYQRAQELIKRDGPGDAESTRLAYVGEGQLLTRERRLREALKALEEAQRIERHERIANYIEMIRRVSEGR
jgi:tetratricopeptide (TPR) repeat protein|tara:strand:- start:4656 stop:6152 length:1497 start_codon:yes stop_codon:yes gene_type:complete